ncbi:hypothetical protein PIB30_098574, partial [Stylosanthes scabra]|nr:hypothetical protein [Stylosanthes scabra]
VTFGLGEKPSTKRDLIFINVVFRNCWTSHGLSRLGLGLAKPKRDMMYAWGGFALVMLNGGRSRLALGVPNVAAILCLSLPLAKDGSRLGLGLAKPKRDMMSFPNMTWFFHDGITYHERKANKDYRLDHILEDMCEKDAQWVRHKDGRPHYLRRSDLEPMSKGWYEFVCRSILPTTNHSELTVERAMLIHSIIIDENINVEEIIAEQIYKFVYQTDISFSRPFPSIIAALCVDAKIRAIPNDTLIPQEPPIIAEAMARTREPRARARQATPPQQPPQQHPQQPPQFQQQ